MADEKTPIAIKKYANRRLYHTGTSTYVTLEDLAAMVQKGEEFVVQDAKTGEDITRAVLTQIIVEQEGKGTNLLPINFLRQLIRFYGDSLQAVVPSYLEASIQHFTSEQERFREQFAGALGKAGFPFVEDAVRKNMAMFREAMKLFTPPFARPPAEPAAPAASSEKPQAEIDMLKAELAAMQKKIEALAGKG